MTNTPAVSIAQNAVCAVLAVQLYASWAAFYDYEVLPFEDLSPSAKQIWIDRALEAIEAVGERRARVLTAPTWSIRHV